MAKREHKERYTEGLFRHFSLFFWYQCAGCHKDFRRERGWRFIGPPYISCSGKTRYICGGCAKTKDDAHAFALAYKPVRPNPMKSLWEDIDNGFPTERRKS